MRILYIATEPIYPFDTGARIRSYHLVKALSAGHEVEVAYFSAQTMAADKQAAYKRAIQLPLAKDWAQLMTLDKIRLLAWSLVRRSFPLTLFFMQSSVLQILWRQLDEFQPNVVVIESSYLLPLAKQIANKQQGIAVVLDAHNIESLLQQRMADTAGSVVMRQVKRVMAGYLRQWEQSTSVYVEGIAAVSEIEAKWWREQAASLPVAVVANGVDIDFFNSAKEIPQAPVIGFCGSMSYLPNQEAVLWFYDQVWPRLVEQVPDVRWLIIGKDPGPQIKRLASEQIMVTGRVDDVRPFIEQTRLSVVPLLAGGGTRLKILESLAMRRTVVSTSVGAEGISASEGLIVVDGAEEMTVQIVAMLRRPDLASLGKRNRQRAITEYSWSSIGQRMVKLVEEVGQ